MEEVPESEWRQQEVVRLCELEPHYSYQPEPPVVYKTPYEMILHARQPSDKRPLYTLNIVVCLCNTAEKLGELRTRVAGALPPNEFALRFRFDYFNVASSGNAKRDQVERDRLETRIQELVMVAHHQLHKRQFNTCGPDLIYIE